MSKKRNRRIFIWAAIILLVLVAIGFFSNKDKEGTKVAAEEAKTRTIIEKVAASGKIYPTTEVKISSDVSGEIVDLLVEEGDSVVAGQLLAKVNPDIYQSAVERGVASVNSAKANAANAKSNVELNRAQKLQAEAEILRIESQIKNSRSIHERNVELLADDIISDADFQASLANLDGLLANLSAAKASAASADANIEGSVQAVKAAQFTVKSNEATLSEMRSNLRRTTIYAPTSGIISSLSVEAGERVVGTAQMAGTEMMRIANLNAMEVQVDVSENDVLRVELGDKVEISVDAYIDRTFQGVVTHIANSATNANTGSLTSDQVTNFIVKANIVSESYKDLISPQKRYPFRPGMSASVDITTKTKENILSVPIQAVTTRIPKREDGTTANNVDPIEVVFVVSGDSTIQTEVKTGIQDDDYIEVLSGINSGTTVVDAPYSAISKNLENGSKIEVVEEKELYKEEK